MKEKTNLHILHANGYWAIKKKFRCSNKNDKKGMQNIAIFILKFEEMRKIKNIWKRKSHVLFFKGMLTSIEPPYVYEYLKPIENGIE